MVGASGQLCAFFVDGAGVWSPPLALTPTNFAPAGAFVFACPDFGAPLPGVTAFVVDATGALQLFRQAAPGLSWRQETVSPSGRFTPGTQQFTVLPGTRPNTEVVNQMTVFIADANATLYWYEREDGAKWSENSIGMGKAGANANVTGLARYFDSQIIVERDLFFVDADGTLNWWTNQNEKGWQPNTIPLGDFQLNPGSHLAATVRFGTASSGDFDDPNVFAVDADGRLLCFSLDNSGAWTVTAMTALKQNRQGPIFFAPPGAPVAAGRHYLSAFGGPYETDVFVVGNDLALYVFTSLSGAAWSEPNAIAANAALPGSFLAVSAQAGAEAPDETVRTDLFLCDINDAANVCYSLKDAAWQREVLPYAFETLVPRLQGNQQVPLTTGTSFLEDLQVDIAITEDLVPALQIDALGNPVGGLSIQLNCNGTDDTTPWEQFSILLSPYTFAAVAGTPTLGTEVQFWNPPTFESVMTSAAAGLGDLPVAGTPMIPAGYSLRIVLKSSGHTIEEAEFFVFNPAGKQLHKVDVKLLKQKISHTSKHVKLADLSKIVFFQLDIVAASGAERTRLLSGAGTITYSSKKTAMFPTFAALVPTGTGEDSNCIYSTLPAPPANRFTQQFQVSP